jgi:hypothetical protein
VQFRTVARELASGAIDLAVTVADELPAGIERRTLFVGSFACLYDPRHVRIGKSIGKKEYFSHKHARGGHFTPRDHPDSRRSDGDALSSAPPPRAPPISIGELSHGAPLAKRAR